MEHNGKITVVGSANVDLVVKTERIPDVGETVLGGEFFTIPGGKGANQAVAAAKLAAEVCFVARVGDDMYADISLNNYANERMSTEFVKRTAGVASGVALITVDNDGNNSIVVSPGANSKLSAEDVEAAQEQIKQSAAVVAQLEIPIETIERAASLAQKHGVKFILDPAPARQLNAELLNKVDVITPNETEAAILTQMPVENESDGRKAASKLLEMGPEWVILTMGSAGYIIADRTGAEFVKARQVEAVDSTAAGDAFTAGLAVGLAQGKDIKQAAELANCAAALSVKKMGAQPSMPTLAEVEQFIAG